jgi:hypothetical protein
MSSSHQHQQQKQQQQQQQQQEKQQQQQQPTKTSKVVPKQNIIISEDEPLKIKIPKKLIGMKTESVAKETSIE